MDIENSVCRVHRRKKEYLCKTCGNKLCVQCCYDHIGNHKTVPIDPEKTKSGSKMIAINKEKGFEYFKKAIQKRQCHYYFNPEVMKLQIHNHVDKETFYVTLPIDEKLADESAPLMVGTALYYLGSSESRYSYMSYAADTTLKRIELTKYPFTPEILFDTQMTCIFWAILNVGNAWLYLLCPFRAIKYCIKTGKTYKMPLPKNSFPFLPKPALIQQRYIVALQELSHQGSIKEIYLVHTLDILDESAGWAYNGNIMYVNLPRFSTSRTLIAEGSNQSILIFRNNLTAIEHWLYKDTENKQSTAVSSESIENADLNSPLYPITYSRGYIWFVERSNNDFLCYSYVAHDYIALNIKSISKQLYV